MTKFIEELKKNNHPTVAHMLKVLRDADIDEGIPYSCSERTFRRDIETLKNNYLAPIAFDFSKEGYYLTNPTWQFDIPVFSTPPKVKVPVNANILRTVFDATREKKVLSLTYTHSNSESEQKKFEPHIITLHNGVWYVRGIERPKKVIRTYAVQRITNISLMKCSFVINRKLVADVKKNGPFDFVKISNILLQVKPGGVPYFREREKTEDYAIKMEKDGSALIRIPPMTESDAVRFVLGSLGAVRVVKPTTLRKRVLAFAQDILKANN